MGHLARIRALDLSYDEITEEAVQAVAWRPPPGWIKPHWFPDEPHPASLPMTKDRLDWCLAILGWSLTELAFRLHTHDASVRQWQKGRRDISRTVAYWLEDKAAEALEGRNMPYGWRDKPMQKQDAVFEDWR